MNEIVSIIQNASPVLAAVILGVMFKLRSQGKDIDELRERIKAYDAMKISAQLASIQTDLAWIKTRLGEVSK